MSRIVNIVIAAPVNKKIANVVPSILIKTETQKEIKLCQYERVEFTNII